MKIFQRIVNKIKNFFKPSFSWIIHNNNMPNNLLECRDILQDEIKNAIYKPGTYVFIFQPEIQIKKILTLIFDIEAESDIKLFKDEYIQTTNESFDIIYELTTGSLITLVFLKE